MNDLAQKLAATTGLGIDQVSRVLAALPNLAYASGAEGFVLPGFGKFSVVPGAERQGRNPITGKTVMLREPPEVHFTIDSTARKAFLAGRSKAPAQFTETAGKKTLTAIALRVDEAEARTAGVDVTQAGKSNFKLGGEPDWIQSPQVPVCCGEPMLFYGQLDSLGGQHCVGDMGMLYVFFCRSCCTPAAILQF